MKLPADLHISPRTVSYLQSLGHDALRVSDVLPVTSPDSAIVDLAKTEKRAIFTQDLDFTNIIAMAGGMDESKIISDFPDITREDIRACLAFAASRERRLSSSAA